MEVNVHGTTHDQPIKDNETIRVYHGFNRIEDAILACTHGISGKTNPNRIYSYEANNNPKGLFVTTQLKTAKDFGTVVIEFHTKVSDLEAPVWPGGGYTVQGEMSANFADENDRERQRLSQRDKLRTSDRKDLSDSDRPELAATLLGSERQALFIGDLNANAIRAVWVSPEVLGAEFNYKSASIRMSPKEFLAKTKHVKDDAESRARNYKDDANPSYKMFAPRDEFDADTFKQKVSKQYKTIPYDEIIEILKKNPDYVSKFFWPKQIPALTKYLDEYEDHS